MEQDPVRQAFEVESAELLDELEKNLLILESSPEDHGVINSIFRAVHTIKGSSGIVGFDFVQGFAHAVENLLVRVRDGAISVSPDTIELLLESRDHIDKLIKLEANGIKPDGYMVSVEKKLKRSIAELLGEAEPQKKAAEETVPTGKLREVTKDSVSSESWHISLRFGLETFRHGLDPVSFVNYMGEIGEVRSVSTILDSVPPLGDIELDACYLAFEIDLKTDMGFREIEDVFEFVRDDCLIRILPPRASLHEYAELFKALPEETQVLGDVLVKAGALAPWEFVKLLEILRPPAPVEEAITAKGPAAFERRKTDLKTIRVDTDKLDALMNIVGEMVLTQASLVMNASLLRDTNLTSSVSAMSRFVEEIREKVTSVRMVPLSSVLSRHYRTVRDISSESGKEISLEIQGGETEVDRIVAEKLNDPLLHLIRNAADHGIEDIPERLSAGKPSAGKVTVNASQEGGEILIRIIDDGKGIDAGAVLEKARLMGIVGPTDTLSREETLALIFHAGLSTKQAATNVSGRGVGMDVVKQNIEGMRGKISISSEKGRGTTISVRLPLTLAIIDGFIVRSGEHKFAIPLWLISECTEFKAGASGQRLFNLRGDLIPYVRLGEFFGVGGRNRIEYLVIVNSGDATIGLAVDELYGEAQIVIKPLGKLYEGSSCLSGAAILGDGSLAFILDIPQIVQEARIRESQTVASGDGPKGDGA